jgi:hypothetical protein
LASLTSGPFSGESLPYTNFYRVLDEQTGKPVPCRTSENVKFAPANGGEKVKFSTMSATEKVKSEPRNCRQVLPKPCAKNKKNKGERKERSAGGAGFSLAPKRR